MVAKKRAKRKPHHGNQSKRDDTIDSLDAVLAQTLNKYGDREIPVSIATKMSLSILMQINNKISMLLDQK